MADHLTDIALPNFMKTNNFFLVPASSKLLRQAFQVLLSCAARFYDSTNFAKKPFKFGSPQAFEVIRSGGSWSAKTHEVTQLVWLSNHLVEKAIGRSTTDSALNHADGSIPPDHGTRKVDWLRHYPAVNPQISAEIIIDNNRSQVGVVVESPFGRSRISWPDAEYCLTKR